MRSGAGFHHSISVGASGVAKVCDIHIRGYCVIPIIGDGCSNNQDGGCHVSLLCHC